MFSWLVILFSDCQFFFVSDPPLEEDDIPDGEWLCNECKARPMEVGNCRTTTTVACIAQCSYQDFYFGVHRTHREAKTGSRGRKVGHNSDTVNITFYSQL